MVTSEGHDRNGSWKRAVFVFLIREPLLGSQTVHPKIYISISLASYLAVVYPPGSKILEIWLIDT